MRTIRQEMKDERTQRMEAEVRMIRSLEETVELSAQRLFSLKTKDTNSVMHVLYDILEILVENINTFCNCYSQWLEVR